jgi:hypothetical protein
VSRAHCRLEWTFRSNKSASARPQQHPSLRGCGAFKRLGGYQDWAADKECLTRHSREAVLSSLHVPNPIALMGLGGRSWWCCAIGHTGGEAEPPRRPGLHGGKTRPRTKVTLVHTSRGVGKSRALQTGQAPSPAGASVPKIVDPNSARPEHRVGRICHQFADGHVGKVGALL